MITESVSKSDILSRIPQPFQDEWLNMINAIEAGDKEEMMVTLDALAREEQTMWEMMGEVRRFCMKASEQFLKLSKDRKYKNIKSLLKHLASEILVDKPPHQLNLFGSN